MSYRADHHHKSEVSGVCPSASAPTSSWAVGSGNSFHPKIPKPCIGPFVWQKLWSLQPSHIDVLSKTDRPAVKPGHGCARQGLKPEPLCVTHVGTAENPLMINCWQPLDTWDRLTFSMGSFVLYSAKPKTGWVCEWGEALPLFSVPRASWHLWPAAPWLGAQGLWFNMARLRNAGYFNIYPQFLLCGTHHMAPSSFSASGVRLGHNKLLGRGVRQSHQPAMRQGQPPLLGSLLTAPCAGFLRQGNQTPLAHPGSLKPVCPRQQQVQLPGFI